MPWKGAVKVGVTIPILTRRSFDFSATSGVAWDIVIVPYLDVIPYRSAVLLTRVHTFTGTARLSVEVRRASPSPDAPEVDFLETATIASSQLDQDPGSMTKLTLTPPFGSHVRILLVPDPAASPAPFGATLSMMMVANEQP